MRVLVVDDTVVYRSQLSALLGEIPGVEVVGTAPDGVIAIKKMHDQSVDLVILDIEMPKMDGLETVKEMKRQGLEKVKVIMFSGVGRTSANSTLEALHVGADDFVQKPGTDIGSLDEAQALIRESLFPKIRQFLTPELHHGPSRGQGSTSWQKVNLHDFHPHVVVIASSTGGPQALEDLFDKLGGEVCPPILIAQHMPPVFTKMLAERLDKISSLNVCEAVDGQVALKGHCYVAPGDFHMELNREEQKLVIKVHQGPRENSVRPAADILFRSAARLLPKLSLGVVLTGMGEDGCQGAMALKDAGCGVFIQDKSSVVWGMPGAVFDAQAYDKMGDIPMCHNIIAALCK